jgi:hypothetical protein
MKSIQIPLLFSLVFLLLCQTLISSMNKMENPYMENIHIQDEDFKTNQVKPQKNSSIQLIPYISLGLLVIPPSWEDLGFKDLENCSNCKTERNQFSYGLGFQGFYNITNDFSIGIDLGWSYLFNYKETLDNMLVHVIEVYTGNIQEFHFVGLIKYSFLNNNYFISGGAGLSLVNEYYKYEYFDFDYWIPDKTEEKDFPEMNFILTGSAGTNIRITNSLAIPIMMRLDLITRYGIMLNLSGTVGLNLNL